jgi:hypothetical protein
MPVVFRTMYREGDKPKVGLERNCLECEYRRIRARTSIQMAKDMSDQVKACRSPRIGGTCPSFSCHNA